MPTDLATTRRLVALSVDIEVLSSDQLKKFVFGIEKKKKSPTESNFRGSRLAQKPRQGPVPCGAPGVARVDCDTVWIFVRVWKPDQYLRCCSGAKHSGLCSLFEWETLRGRYRANASPFVRGVLWSPTRLDQGGKTLDYYKHIIDLAWDFRQPFGNHRSFEIETALMLGKLGVPGQVPAAERFFGGNVGFSFIEAEDWRIRAAPLIRSLPNRGLSRLSQDARVGGESYVALNLTVAATAWRLPLLPDQVSREPDFKTALQIAENGVLGAIISEYRAEVTRTDAEVALLEPIIDAMPAIVSELERLEPEDSDADWFECQFITGDIERTARKLTTEPGALGQVTAALETAIHTCKEDQKIGNEQADNLFGGVRRLVEQMQAGYEARPEVIAATERANNEFKPPKRAIDAFTNEMNLLSISPLVIFDAARIGPQPSSAGGGLRFGIGGGLRFGLASHVNFDIGYVVNPNPEPWEGRGALFFAMRFLELLR